MSDTVIRVENLGKRYLLKHQQQGRSRYVALRDVIADGVKAIGQQILHPKQHKPSRTREEFWALKDVSFEVKRGEVVGIIGRNGAGKSTLLKLLSRITEPTTGRISIKGRVGSLLEVGTGFHPELTGRENIYLNGAILGMTKAEIRRKFDEIVDFAEVEKFLDTPVKHYSSGMYVRLAFSVAAYLEPDVLVVDEVLAVGDTAFQKKCLGKMQDFSRKESRTVFLVSHNMASILSLCNRAFLLDSGCILETGEVSDVVDKYAKIAISQEIISLEKRHDRSGDGSTRFVNISVRSTEASGIIRCNSTVEIILSYRGNDRLKNVSFAIGIYDYSNAEIYLIDSDLKSQLPEILPAEGKIKCILGPINLTPGECYINIAIITGGIIGGALIDYVQHATTFTVEASDFYGSGKLPPRNWSLCLVPHDWYAA